MNTDITLAAALALTWLVFAAIALKLHQAARNAERKAAAAAASTEIHHQALLDAIQGTDERQNLLERLDEAVNAQIKIADEQARDIRLLLARTSELGNIDRPAVKTLLERVESVEKITNQHHEHITGLFAEWRALCSRVSRLENPPNTINTGEWPGQNEQTPEFIQQLEGSPLYAETPRVPHSLPDGCFSGTTQDAEPTAETQLEPCSETSTCNSEPTYDTQDWML